MPGSANTGNPVGIRWAWIVFVRVHPPSEARRSSADNGLTIELRANELFQDTAVGHGQPALDQGHEFRVTSAAHFLCDSDERGNRAVSMRPHAYHMTGSMSRRGSCWDNACVGSFLGSLKRELIHLRHYRTRVEARQEIVEYLEVFYNRPPAA